MIQIDIEMPEKCGLCPLFHAEHPMHCQGAKADRKKKIVAPYGQPRPDWCLLHEATVDHDTVNRKQAIEAINSLFGFNIEEEYGSAVQEVINGLPSAQPEVLACGEGELIAQPEIVRCKDCKHKGTKNCVANAWTTIFGVMVKDDFYCGLAERRTDG